MVQQYLESLSQALDWFESVAVDRWNLACLGEHGMINHARPRDRAEALRAGAWAWSRNLRGENVYLRPARGTNWSVVMLDDLPANMVTGIAQKYSSLVLETSSHNFQVWVFVNQPLTEPARLNVQRHLLQKAGADPGSASGEHFGRAPGYRNTKPDRGNFLARIAAATRGLSLDVAPYLTAAPVSSSPAKGGACAISRGSTVCGTDESRREFGYCLARLDMARRAGRLAWEMFHLEWDLARRAVERGKRKDLAAAKKYANLTVRKALSVLLSAPRLPS
jgi:hypothetical protein